MTAFDATLNATSLRVIVDDDSKDRLFIGVEISQVLPIRPQGVNGEALQAPIGNIRFALDRETALKLGEELSKQGKELDKPLDLAIATDLAEAEAVSKALKSDG